ncbi:MAG: hypothetical protein BMS9Abin33_0518 [Gammaproteobacteria bacterium]|nr:MAG: hypothetical protein BMS9Abin33_0518 [Gammaproteobacteria bacterium]
MRKYAFADENGKTPDNIQLKPGKYLAKAGSKNDLMLRIVHASGESPEMAALVNIEDQATHPMKLYSIQQWLVDPNATDGKVYMIVKEVEAPVVRLEQKLEFAIAALSNLNDNDAFKKWADGWLTNADRGKDTTMAINKIVKEELEGINSLVAMGVSTGYSHEEMQQKIDLFTRIEAVTEAAALAVDAPKSDENVSRLLVKATENIQKVNKETNLVDLAEKICAENK